VADTKLPRIVEERALTNGNLSATEVEASLVVDAKLRSLVVV